MENAEVKFDMKQRENVAESQKIDKNNSKKQQTNKYKIIIFVRNSCR